MSYKDDNERLQAGVLPPDPWADTQPVATPAPFTGLKLATPAGADRWPAVVPFDRIVTPEFPVAVLPDWHRRFVEAVAAETETKPDLAALCALTATASVCARRFVIEQRLGFTLPANLWTMTMLSSGNRKSAVFNRAVAPLRDFEGRQAAELQPRIAAEGSQRRRLEATLRKLEKAAADAQDPDLRRVAEVEAEDVATRLSRFKVTTAPRLFLSEATPERLEETLMEQGGRAAVLAAEPSLFRVLAGQHRGKASDPNLGSILDAYDGGDIRVGRMRREDGTGGDRIVLGAVVTIGLAPQPERIMSALHATPAFWESGFAHRFLFSLPASLLGERRHNGPPAPPDVLAEYAGRMGELLELPATEPDLPVVRLAPEARQALLDFERKLEPSMRPGAELATLVPWTSKLTSKLARIAGLFHAAEHRREPWLSPLELGTMERAISMADYFIVHARAVLFEFGADEDMKRAGRAVAWIRHRNVRTFTRRDLHKAVANNASAAEAQGIVDRLCSILTEHGFVRPVRAALPNDGRKGAAYEVNPEVHEARHGG